MPKRDHLFPGQGFVRYVKAVAEARGDHWRAFMIAKNNDRIARETPEVIDVLEMFTKTTVNVGTTSDSTWAGPLVVYQNLQNEFISYLRPLTILGRIPGMRRVPFKVKIPRQTAAAAVNWVGEARVKPLTSLAFDTVTLDFNKIAGIIPLSEELVRLSDPSAEQTVRDDLAAAIVQFMDRAFIDPTAAATDVSPASVTNAATPVTATGTTMAALRADVATLFSTFLQNNVQASNLVWIMTQTQALKIGLTLNSLGQPVYPGINVNGGNFLGIPVITSENVPYVGSSPTDGSYIVLLNAGEVLLADDGQVTIDASREASLQFDTSPDSPPTASTNMISLWQMNMIAIKAERFVTWKMRRSNAVGVIQYAKYAE
jgi:HK97 family phage major capsid protein